MLISAVASLMLSACSGVGPEDSKTENINAQYRVTSTGLGIELQAQFFNGSDSAILLEEGDQVRVHYDGRSQILYDTEGNGAYKSTMLLSSVYENENFRFALERAEEIGAPNSNIYLPQGFSADSAQTADAIYYTDSIEVTWDSDDALDTQFNILRIYQCQDGDDAQFTYFQEESVDDTGSAIINDSELLVDDNLVGCQVTIELGRFVSSGVDSRFKGGSSVGIQLRELNFDLVFVESEAEAGTE